MYFPVPSLLIEFLILAIIDKKDSYGYEISQTVKLIANIKESSLYPILKKLENNYFLSTYTEEHQGRKRKYYTITVSGRDQLSKLTMEWQNYQETISAIIEGRLRHEKD